MRISHKRRASLDTRILFNLGKKGDRFYYDIAVWTNLGFGLRDDVYRDARAQAMDWVDISPQVERAIEDAGGTFEGENTLVASSLVGSASGVVHVLAARMWFSYEGNTSPVYVSVNKALSRWGKASVMGDPHKLSRNPF